MKAILVVEDELSIRSFICLNLRRKKYKVLEAETGEKAIEMFASSPVDVVLLDLMLPGMEGFTERLITMVEILLDFSRYQSDRVTVSFQPVNLEELVLEAVFQLQKKAEKKDIQLVTSTAFLEVNGDGDKLKQVLLNKGEDQSAGEGIGLSISQKIVELHGGKLEIESEYGTGTTVTILIPENDSADHS